MFEIQYHRANWSISSFQLDKLTSLTLSITPTVKTLEQKKHLNFDRVMDVVIYML